MSNLNNSLRIKILILLITAALVALMFPKGISIESEVFEGSVWTSDDLIATKNFPILKDPQTLAKERAQAAAEVLPVFNKKPEVYPAVSDSIKKFNKVFVRFLDSVIAADSEQIENTTFLSDDAFAQFLSLRRNEGLLSSKNKLTFGKFVGLQKNLLKLIYKRGYLDKKSADINRDSIAVREGKYEVLKNKDDFLDERELDLYITNYLRNSFSRSAKLNNAALEYIAHFLRPNLIYSAEETELAKNIAMEKVEDNNGFVLQNERIVAKHDLITKEIKQKIDSYRIAKGEDQTALDSVLQVLGISLHILIALALFILYLFSFRKEIYKDNKKILLISIIFLITVFQAFLTNQINVGAPIYLLVLIPSASMLLTIIFDSRIGFFGAIVISLISGALRGNDYVFVLMNMFAGAVAAFTVRDIKNRNQIFRSFLFILFAYVISLLAFGLEQFKSLEDILVSFAFAGSNALLSPIFTFGLIIFFEKSFKITTDLTYLELTDFNMPLLKSLAKNTPGTFTHSITIGSMVESAAEVIGANPILARVGAYYHDIGKTIEPEAFVENQLNNVNLHTELPPEESCKIIIDHVSRGLDLAKEYGLPKEVRDFIPMHHGTLVVKFFLEKYKELHAEEEVDESIFRYPGPKPNTKETALVMLADACESAVRAMDEPDEHKIKNIVDNLIQQRIDDGQLDDTPLTFNDVDLIKDAFFKVLIGQHHRRIRYPKQDEMENEPPQNSNKND